MGFDYSYVLPPTGPAENAPVREMFEDVKAYVNTLISGGGSGAPNTAQYVTLVADASLTSERVLTAGTAISLTDNGAGSTVVVANTGVTALATTNVNLSFNHSTGSITAAFASTPTFDSLIFQSATGAIGLTPSASAFTSYNLTFPLNTGTSGYILSTNGATPTATLSWIANTGGVTSVHGTTNQVSVSVTTGSVTLSLPQDIATGSSPSFAQVKVGAGVGSDPGLQLGATYKCGFFGSGDDKTVTLQVNAQSFFAAHVDGFDRTLTLLSGTDLITTGDAYINDLNIRNAGLTAVLIKAPSSFTTYTLTLPTDDGSANQYLTTDGSGVLSWTNAAGTGTVNSGTQYQLAYYATSTTAVSGLTLITGSKALASDSNGLPVASATTATELGYVNGVTSAIQTQIDTKAASSAVATKALDNLASVAVNTSLLPGSDNAIDLGSSTKNFRSIYTKTSLILQQTGVGTNAITIAPPASITSHTLTLPSAQGGSSTVLQNNGSGALSWVSISSAGGATAALDNLASVAINTALLPGTDNSIDLGSTSKRWVNIYAKDIDAGASGTAGSLDIFPSTSAKGKITISAAASAGDTATTITNASQAGARTYTIPDGGASANFVLSEGAATINGVKTFGSAVLHADGLVGSPGISFSSDPDNGMYMIGANNPAISAGGTKCIDILSTGVGILGPTSNTSAAAGNLGEVITAQITTATNYTATTNQYQNVTNIALTPGCWRISGQVQFILNGATLTGNQIGAISINSANTTTDHVDGDNVQYASVPTSTARTSCCINYILKLTGNTTTYLKVRFGYSGGTPQYVGTITAVRI